MRIIRGLKGLHEVFPRPVVTLGNFDGVHLGHQAILRRAVERARQLGGTSLAFTFEPHPLKVLAPERSPRLLNTFHGKMALFSASGIDIVVCADFTREFAEQHPADFARDVLHEKLGAVEVFVGYDYAFGKRREGGIDFLRRMGAEHGFLVNVVEAVQLDGIVVSSSAIRERIANGDVEQAAELLGRPYSIEGEVVHGAHRGRQLGFPTANIKSANELLPGLGVYAVTMLVREREFEGVASIGIRPTFDAGPLSVEVFLFDFDGDLYGSQVEIRFLKRLRGEQKFPDIEALKKQIRDDVQNAKAALSECRARTSTKG
jgi:riboflavin kinase/FMN adenylyltransferase